MHSSQNPLSFSLHSCWVHVVQIQTDGGKHKEPEEKVLEPGRKTPAEALWGSQCLFCILGLSPVEVLEKPSYREKWLECSNTPKSHPAELLTGVPHTVSPQTI